MPKSGDFIYNKHREKCFVTGWGRRTESKLESVITSSLEGMTGTAGLFQLTEEFEFPTKIVFANNSMVIDLTLRF